MKKSDLLTIGDFAKYSDRSIKSIHYYERLGILTPAYIDPETNYRYFTHDQIAILETAQFFTELDVPLKDIPLYTDDDNRILGAAFLQAAEKVTLGKLATIQKTLSAIHHAQNQLSKANAFKYNPVPYTLQEKMRYFYIVPCEETQNLYDFRKSTLGVFKTLHSLGISEEALLDMENGMYYEFKGLNLSKYYFIELPEPFDSVADYIKIIPAGNFDCWQDLNPAIEKAASIFKELPLIAIETEIFSDPYDLNRPLWELKVFLPSKNRQPVPDV